MIKISVIVCTYHPNLQILKKVLHSLSNQTLDKQHWDLIMVNNTLQPIPGLDSMYAHYNLQIINEPKLGLINARLAGFKRCKPNSLMIFVDDDNVLNESYLETCLEFNSAHPEVGCFGGKSLPVYETSPPGWFFDTGINLGCQNFGDEQYISNYKRTNYKLTEYPEKAPIGTGLAISYHAFLGYAEGLNSNKLKLGRKGADLTSGEDNDIILTVINNRFEIAYVPGLIVEHLIPEKRYSFNYLKKMAYKSNRSWIKVLELHHLNQHAKIPKWSVPFRQIKAWIMLKAWHSKLNYIKWRGACGVFRALSEISNG